MGHGVRFMFHSTVFTPDYRATRDALVRLVGMRVLEYSEDHDPAIGRAGGMSWIGDNALEIGEPLVPGSPQQRWLDKFGGGNHSIAVQVNDIVAAVDHLRERGYRIHRAATGYPYHIVFTDPRDFGGVLIEWFEGMPPFDPRWGALLPEAHMTPLVPVVQQAWVGAFVADPVGLAERLADGFDSRVTFVELGAPDGRPRAGVSLGDCTLALYELPSDDQISRRLWGREHRLPRVGLLVLRVEDLDAAYAALRAGGVNVVRYSAGLLVCEPGPLTGGVEVAFADHLLPGDPRRVDRDRAG